jgi:type II secretory pathway pseudopilin PulG
MRSLSNARGFTFVEVLATLLFLAILVPVVSEALTLSSRAAVVSERSALAVELAENKLNELVLNNTWIASEQSGDFGTEWSGFRWEMTQNSWDIESMTQLGVKVYYQVQGREHSIQLNTLVSN